MFIDKALDGIDWQRIVNVMNVPFGIFRYVPPQYGNPSDIELLYANEIYVQLLHKLGYDPSRLRHIGYARDGSYLDIQMIHSVKRALRDRVKTKGKLLVTSMGIWVKYYITPIDLPNCYSVALVDIDEEQHHLMEAERLGSIDTLTGVKNRNALEAARESLGSQDVCLGVLVADLNGLKQINDTEGHKAGDEAIAGAAQLLKSGMPSWDIYRYGGDEFVVLAPGTGERDFAHACERFAKSLSLDGELTLSVGYAWGESSRCINDILHAADDAMYEEKRAYYTTHDRRR